MQANTTRKSREQPHEPYLVRITTTDQLTSAELTLILQSRSRDQSGFGKIVDVSIWPDVRRHDKLEGSYICPQCRGRHSSGLAEDGDILRIPRCSGYLSPDGERVDSVRLRWQRPEDIPPSLAAELDRPQIDWSPVCPAWELLGLAEDLRRRRAAAFSDRERERLVAIYRYFVRCNEYQAELAERVNGDASRTSIGRVQRDLRREMLRRHIGPGRVTVARKVAAAASVLECLHSRGSLFW